MKRALVYGRYHLSWIAWSVCVERGLPPPMLWYVVSVSEWARLVLAFLGRLLLFTLPYFKVTKDGWGAHFLTLHVGIVTGPYECAYCGNATTQGPNLERGEKAHCWRCIGKMHDEREKL